ncbi:unnamed protein product [Hymenolepis diminuta]|uniref:CXXC-type zinc finger protein 1 n=2 Tax=Hymenolepis diminuta TaxID=6216 RepID=A0A564YHV4_HYMDI|nr:unnamed protein product [Hymenolepis diminuta]
MSYDCGRSVRGYHSDSPEEDEYIQEEDFDESDEDADEEFIDDDDTDDEDWNARIGSSRRIRDDHRHKPPVRPLPRKSSSSSLNWRPRKNGSTGSKAPRRPPPKVTSQQSMSNFSEQNGRRRVRLNVPEPRKESESPRQCLGPGCTRPAADSTTKYCSKECGLTLALKRLERYLPEARASWYNDPTGIVLESEADWTDRERLKEVRTERNAIIKRLMELETQLGDLNKLIMRAHKSKSLLTSSEIAASASADKADGESAEPVVCVTCSSEVSLRQALRHMDKCFQKVESASLLCSSIREQSRGTPLFCDAYDSHAKAYCKRLRAVCEHVKDPKYPADAICGLPLVQDVFTPTERFCCTPRSKCSLHFGWERKKRANIDMKRYRQLLRNDELLHEESRLIRSLSQRAGILGMILNRTVDEEAKQNEDLK